MQGKKPTREQRKFIQQYGYDTHKILVLQDHRHFDGTMTVKLCSAKARPSSGRSLAAASQD